MRWTKYLIVLFSICLVFSCSKKTSYFYSSINSVEELTLRGAKNDSLKVYYNGSNEIENYIPDTLQPLLHKKKIIKMVIHFMYDSLGQHNFEKEEGKKFVKNLVSHANKRLRENQKMNLPLGNDTPVLPLGYQYKIVPGSDQKGDDGYYFHNDEELYWFCNKGKNRNNYSRTVIKKYNVGGDSLLNVFIMPHHPDSIASKTYKAHGTGIALGNSLKMSGLYHRKKEGFWAFASLLNHEVGHILGLRHAWIANDGCDDTPKNPNCWDQFGPPPCDKGASNNLMDYNNSQGSITPCQIGIMHKYMTKYNARQRKFVRPDWCKLDTSQNIIIDKDTHWKGEKDLTNDVVVRAGNTLRISSRVSFAEQSKLSVDPGARLILDNCWLHNSCSSNWKGIELIRTEKDSSIIEYLGKVRIENVQAQEEI